MGAVDNKRSNDVYTYQHTNHHRETSPYIWSLYRFILALVNSVSELYSVNQVGPWHIISLFFPHHKPHPVVWHPSSMSLVLRTEASFFVLLFLLQGHCHTLTFCFSSQHPVFSDNNTSICHAYLTNILPSDGCREAFQKSGNKSLSLEEVSLLATAGGKVTPGREMQ